MERQAGAGLPRHPRPDQGPGHAHLDDFVGVWRVEGRNGAATADDPEALVTGIETYAWLDGGFFLQVSWDRRSRGRRHKGTGVIGFDSSSRPRPALQ